MFIESFNEPTQKLSLDSLSTPIARAREIMGERFFGAEEVQKIFPKIFLSREANEIMFSEELLSSLNNNWRLVFIPNISIEEMVSLTDGFIHRYGDARYHLPLLARKGGDFSWELISVEPIAGSVGKDFFQQTKLLKSGEKIPTSRQVIFLWLLEKSINEKIIFSDVYVRCHEKVGDYHTVVASDGERVTIGGAISSLGYQNVGLAVSKSHF
jgi:hypothetical protein